MHAEELERLSAWATAHEDNDEIREAHDAWLQVLPLLPDSTQAAWVQKRVRSLKVDAKSEEAAPPRNNWAKKLGPLAPLAIAPSKAKESSWQCSN